MAVDNSVLPPGGGGDSVRDIDRLGGGIKTQVAQLDFGGDNTHPEQLVTLANGLPVQPATGQVWDVSDRVARLLGHVTIDNVSIPVTGTFWQATQPISAVALPLPAGAATDGGLATIDADIKANQPRTVNVIAGFALEAGHLATIDAKTPALGQAVMALSSPVAMASDQVLPLPTNAVQELGGNISTLAGIERARANLAMLSAQLQLIQPTNGFFPVEIPAFLGGI